MLHLASGHNSTGIFFPSVLLIYLLKKKKTHTEFLLQASSDQRRFGVTNCGKLRSFTLQPLGPEGMLDTKVSPPSLICMSTHSCLYEEMPEKASVYITVQLAQEGCHWYIKVPTPIKKQKSQRWVMILCCSRLREMGSKENPRRIKVLMGIGHCDDFMCQLD